MPSTQFAWSPGCQKSERWVIESVTLKRLNEVEWRQGEITGFLSPQALKLIPSFLLYKFMRYRCYNKNFYVEYFISLIISACFFSQRKAISYFCRQQLAKARDTLWFWLWRSCGVRSMRQCAIGHYLRYRMSRMSRLWALPLLNKKDTNDENTCMHSFKSKQRISSQILVSCFIPLVLVNWEPLSFSVTQPLLERLCKCRMAWVMDYSFIWQSFHLLKWCVHVRACTCVRAYIPLRPQQNRVVLLVFFAWWYMTY